MVEVGWTWERDALARRYAERINDIVPSPWSERKNHFCTMEHSSELFVQIGTERHDFLVGASLKRQRVWSAKRLCSPPNSNPFNGELVAYDKIWPLRHRADRLG